MNITLLLSFVLSSLLIAALPGPAMMLTIQGSIEQGWRKGINISLGILLGDIVLLLAVIAGVGELLAQSPAVLNIMNVMASLYLIYLGIRSLCDIRFISQQTDTYQYHLSWKTGFWVTVINPKTIVFLLAYFPQFIDVNSHWAITQQLEVLGVLFLISVASVMFGYAFSAHLAKHFLSQIRVRQTMAIIFGILLIYIGISGFFN